MREWEKGSREKRGRMRESEIKGGNKKELERERGIYSPTL